MANKVYFDPLTRIIEIIQAPVSGVVDINFQTDVYSDGKEDWIVSGTLNKLKFPIRSVGGDVISDTKNLGATFFLQYGWQLRPYSENHRLRIDGNIYTEPSTASVVLPASGSFSVIVENTVSNLTDATIAQLPQIEYASFQNVVWVDVSSSNSGITFPIGTPERPVNNFTDALAIAAYRGFDTIHIKSDFTELDSSHDFSNFIFIGDSSQKTFVYINPNANVENCEFEDCILTGYLDGQVTINNCTIYNLYNFNGLVKDTLLNPGILGITGSGYVTTHFLNCWSGVPGTSTPTIDCGGSGSALSIRNYNGGILLQNKTGPEAVSIDLNSGQVKLTSTITNGEIVIRGVGQLSQNDATGSAMVNTIGLMAKDTIADAVLNTSLISYTNASTVAQSLRTIDYANVVSIDETSPYSGSDYPVGTTNYPVNNIMDAAQICTNTGIDTIHIHGNYTFTNTDNISNLYIRGGGKQSSIFTFQDGAITAYCKVESAKLTGYVLGFNSYDDCYINNVTSSGLVPSSMEVIISNCIIQGAISIPGNFTGKLDVIDCWAFPTDGGIPTLDMNGGNFDVQIRNFSGYVNIVSCSQDNDIRIFLSQGGVRLDSSVTSGSIRLSGVATLVDSSSGAIVDTTSLISQETIAEAVWNEPLTTHTINGTIGRLQMRLRFGDAIYINGNSGSAGTTFPIGTSIYPSNNLTDALYIMRFNGLNALAVQEHFDLTTGSGEYLIRADYWEDSFIDLNNQYIDSTNFKNITISGSMNGGELFAEDCYINGVQNINGEILRCRLARTNTIASGGYFSGTDVVLEGDETIIDLQNNVCTASFDFNSGYIMFINAVSGSLIEVNTKGGEVELDASCVGGDFYIEGVGRLYNNSAMNIKGDNLISLDSIPFSVWDDQLGTYVTPGSAGYALSNVSAGASPALIAQAVWNDTASLYTATSSFGYSVTANDINLQLILGLVQHNFRMTNQIYDANGNMTSAEVNIYPSSADATAETNSINTYYITAVYDGNNRLIDYKMIE